MTDIHIARTPSDHGTRIEALLDGAGVSRLWVFDLPMRVGPRVLRCGGIGGVGTNREQRNKGHSRLVLEDSAAYMREEGYHLSALFGIAEFYPKFGFGPGLIECEAQIATRYAERAEPCYPVRPFEPGDAATVAAIYQELHATRTGSITRDPATWTGFRRGTRWSERIGAFVVLDGERVIGYACYDLDVWRVALSEVGCATPAAYSTIVAEAARMAVEKRTEHIILYAPPDDPFLRYCRRFGCELKLTYPFCNAGMARVIDQDALLAALQPLATERARGVLDGGATVVFATDLGESALVLGEGGPTWRAEMPQWMLAQLALGYRDAGQIALEETARIDAEALPALLAAFPEGYPYIHWSDRF